jgi:hypothetical protein
MVEESLIHVEQTQDQDEIKKLLVIFTEDDETVDQFFGVVQAIKKIVKGESSLITSRLE